MKVPDIDLGDGIDALVLVVEEPDRSGHSFRCCFQRPEIGDHIVDADFVAAGFLAAVLTGDIPAVEEPFCLAFADAADAVQLVCTYDFGIFLVEEGVICFHCFVLRRGVVG